MSWRSIAVGALSLAVLDAAVSNGGSKNFGPLLELPGKWAQEFISPDVPLIPDYSGSSGSDQTSALQQQSTNQPVSSLPNPKSVPVGKAVTPVVTQI